MKNQKTPNHQKQLYACVVDGQKIVKFCHLYSEAEEYICENMPFTRDCWVEMIFK